MDVKILGSNIQKCRVEKGLTQEVAAEQAGLSSNYYRQIELGNKIPKLETFIRIAEVLDASADQLLMGNASWTTELKSNELYRRIEKLPSKRRECILNAVDALVDGIEKI